MRRLAIVAVLVALACGGGSTSPSVIVQSIDGRWSGTVSGHVIDLSINEARGGELTGAGELKEPDGSLVTLTVSGTHGTTKATIHLTSDPLEDMRYDASLRSETEMVGPLTGAGFDRDELRLNKR